MIQTDLILTVSLPIFVGFFLLTMGFFSFVTKQKDIALKLIVLGSLVLAALFIAFMPIYWA